jgi:diguanylate cyclase (GGDEF)-like protein/PAS domain S-box-containing protein
LTMYRVISCLTTEHDPWLVALAAVVCAGTALVSFLAYSQATLGAKVSGKFGWCLVTGVCAGSGIWATHFVAMLAYDGGLPTSYEAVATMQSLFVAIVVASAGYAVSLCGFSGAVVAGGILLGLSIGAMHHLGMSALLVPGKLQLDQTLFVLSWIIGAALGAASLVAFHSLHGWRGLVGAALLLTMAICGLHFTAMGAVTIDPDPSLAFEATLDKPMLAIATAALVLIIWVGTGAAVWMQRTSTQCESVLREQNARFEAALRYLPVGFSMFDSARKLVVCNGAYRNMYGLSEAETLHGTSFETIIHRYAGEQDGPERAALGGWLLNHLQKLSEGQAFTENIKLADGRRVFVRVGPVEGGGWVDVHEDITERSLQEEKIAHLASHDALTGLPNRSLLQESLDYALREGGEGNLALLYMDLDRFKEVNDIYGHRVGDQLLVAVSERLMACVRTSDVLARIGGDEFVLFVDSAESETASELARRIIAAVSAPYNLEGHQLVIGISIGIAIAGKNTNSDSLLAQADLALYRSKSIGKGTYSFFEEEMDNAARAQRTLERDLRAALANGELEIHYQPQVNISTHRVQGFEALLRWRHPQRGVVSPSEFIPVAEQTGLINPIGDWVLRTACVEASRWPDDVKVAVNVSTVQFRNSKMLDSVVSAVAAAGIPFSKLEIEITESALADDCAETLALLEELHGLGVTIAMDDFGTGYSSLGYLRTYPFDKIKIDRSFVSGVTGDKNGRAIVRAICGLGRSLGLAITAEGVETPEQLVLAEREGCTEVQGFLFSAPFAADRIPSFLLTFANRRDENARRARKCLAS